MPAYVAWVSERDNREHGAGAGAPADPDRPGARPQPSTEVLEALVAFLDDVVERPAGAPASAPATSSDDD
jgi:hypothetical protein